MRIHVIVARIHGGLTDLRRALTWRERVDVGG